MGLLCDCALTDRLKDPANWKGTDDDEHWWTRWRLKKKHWFAFSDRCHSQGLDLAIIYMPFFPIPILIIPVFRKWRSLPKVLFAVKGKGYWRFENLSGGNLCFENLDSGKRNLGYYLSRVQYHCRWHFALYWPLCYSFHVYPKAEDVMKLNERTDVDGKVINGYRGFHFDGEAFWGDGGFLGTVFK